MGFMKKALFIFFWLCVMSGQAYSAPLSIACAANFTSAMKELTTVYTEETGSKADCTYGSTGMLFGQITNGAPYDLFFAADEKRPALLHEQGLALKPIGYARGTVVLWSKNASLSYFKDWKAAACNGAIKTVGIASPKTAPYGARANEAMVKAKIYEKIQPKLVFGKSVGVSFQYAYSGAADVAFVALSQALSDKGKAGVHWAIPEASLVDQDVCVITRGDTEAALTFLKWLETSHAQSIIKRYGYE